MKECMTDNAHDKEHIYRVLYLALDIANFEINVNGDILLAACLLHDIGREKQFENPQICHAQAGAEMAYEFCFKSDFSEEEAQHIQACISSHRFRGNNPPESIEAKILFDADKLDVSGAIGIARTLFYKGITNEPLYNTDENGNVSDGINDAGPSFLKEYNYKLKNIYDKLYTKRAKEIAEERRNAAVLFYENLLSELSATYENGTRFIKSVIETEN